MGQEVRAFWQVGKKPFSLGNLLIFRQEVELLATIQGKKKVIVDLVGDEVICPPYMEELFKSEIEFTFVKTPTEASFYDWPEENQRRLSEAYSTLQRIVRLCHETGIEPCLKWSEEVVEGVKNALSSLKSGGRSVYVCHLKKQAGGSEESNANQESWLSFFQRNSSALFILLGSDAISFDILSCHNVVSAEKLGWPLSVQLAACQQVNGFIGMASGLSCGPMFSSVPYAIFKHPLHHVEEMILELGETDYVGFAESNQRLLRQVDTLENLETAFSQMSII